MGILESVLGNLLGGSQGGASSPLGGVPVERARRRADG